MRIWTLTILLFAAISTTANAQDTSTTDWGEKASVTCRSLVRHFWGASFRGAENQKYFNALGGQASMKNEWWWQAHSMDVIIDEYRRTADEHWLGFYEPWYEGIQDSNYEFFADDPLHNNSIDDMEWLCITMIRMYETCGDQRFFNHARLLYDRYIITTWGPEDEGPWFGGISWSSDEKIRKSKNACSNGPAGIVAYMLARNLEGHESEKYIDDLKRIFCWERKNLFNEETGIVYDNIGYGGIGKAAHSYNTGTFIAMARELFVRTHEPQYLLDAQKAADFAIKHFAYGKEQLMSLLSRRDNGGDGGLFHGIFFRYLAELIQAHILPADVEQRYVDYLFKCGDLAARNLVSNVNIFSRDWENIRITNPYGAPLTPHVSGATLMQVLAILSAPDANGGILSPR